MLKKTAWVNSKDSPPPVYIEVVVKDRLGNIFIGELRVGQEGNKFWVVKGSDLATAPVNEYPVWCAVPA